MAPVGTGAEVAGRMIDARTRQFRDVDLLALSACSTALGSADADRAEGRGRGEVDNGTAPQSERTALGASP